MAYYARYDWDVAPQAVEVTVSDPDPDFPAENVISDTPAMPCKLTATTGWILFEYGSKQIIVAASLIYAYLTAGLNVRLQASDSSDFSTPAVDVPIVIPAKRLDGPTYQRWTMNPWAWVGTLPDPTGYLFWRVYFPSANDQNIVVGKVLLLTALESIELYHEAADLGEKEYGEDAFVDQKTIHGVRTVEILGGPQRTFNAALVGTDVNAGTAPVQEAADFRALMQSVEGMAHPWLFIPFDDTNDACLVQNETPEWDRSYKAGGYQVFPFTVREVTRGIPFP